MIIEQVFLKKQKDTNGGGGEDQKKALESRRNAIISQYLKIMPCNIQRHLMAVLLDNWQYRKQCASWIYGFMNKKTTRVDLSSLDGWDYQSIGRFESLAPCIASQCTGLHTLIIPRCMADKTCLENMLTQLPHLVTLNLANTTIDDNTLPIIGAHCTQLLSLNIAGSRISDNGIELFCQSVSPTHALEELFLETTVVTECGLGMALTHLKKLQQLRHNAVIKAINLLHNDEPNQAREEIKTTYLLRSIDVKILAYDVKSYQDFPHMLEVVCERCPYLESFEIYAFLPIMDADCFSALSHLQHLRRLSLTGSMSFKPDIETMLSYVGSTMRELCLHGISNIDLNSIALRCPRLQVLDITGPEIIELHMIHLEPTHQSVLYPHLKKLCIYSGAYNVPNHVILNLIVNCPHVEDITVSSMTLHDDTWLEILRLNPLQNLKHLQLQRCQIPLQAVTKLLHESTSLEDVSLKYCSDYWSFNWDSVKFDDAFVLHK